MYSSIDLYLGSFLILCGFALSSLNLRRIVQDTKAVFPTVLLSENILLTCIGIAFIIRSIREVQPFNGTMDEMDLRSSDTSGDMICNYASVLMSYGPLIVSLVNSFVTLIVDNYMHYQMIADVKKDEEDNTVRNINEDSRTYNRNRTKRLLSFSKKYFTLIAIAMQWILPILVILSMYPIDVKERRLFMDYSRRLDAACIAMVDMQSENCSWPSPNHTLELRKYPANYFEMYEMSLNNTNEKSDSVVNNVYKILADLQNESIYDFNVTKTPLLRKPKNEFKCMKVCYIDNKSLILYMFAVAVVSYFVPITISIVILTKIHMMDVKKPNVKVYVSRELLYNILFWTPVMFDTFLSLTLCKYTMNGVRTSIFNVIANVYQALKNFMNTKYFKENAISPV